MSNNLDLDQVAGSQDQKEVTINDQAGQLDAALTNQTTFSVTSSNALTLTAAQLRESAYFIFDEDGSDPADAAITITCPAIKRGLFIARNDTAFEVTIEVSSQPADSPTIAAGNTVLLACDGTNVEQPAGSGSSASPYDVGSAFGGTPTASLIIMQFIFPRAVTFPVGLSPSQGTAGTASTGTATFDIRKNGSSVGSMVYTASATATFAMTAATSYAAGDLLEIVAPATPDATLANLVFTVAGTRD